MKTEDYQGQLISTLRKLAPIENSEIVELGAGTGRVTMQLLSHAKWVYAFDLTSTMIRLANHKLKDPGSRNGSFAIADSRAVPLSSRSADIVIEGWSFIQIMAWHKENWQQEVGQAIQEMMRMLRPGGVAILVETLGTGEVKPSPPAAYKAAYEYFEREWQFSSKWIRTDYCFSTMAQAHDVAIPVFGESMLERVFQSEEGIILPECTGIWWRSV